MMFSGLHFLFHWFVSGLAVLLTSKLIPGFEIKGFFSACVAVVFIGLFNAVLWPVFFVLTLPINVLTFGLFTFVINGAILKICAALLPGFSIDSWSSAILGSIVLSVINVLLHFLFV